MSTSACLHGCSACQAHLLHIHSRGATLPEVHAALLHAQHAQGALLVGRRLAEVDLGRLGQLAGEDKGLLQGSTLGPSALQDDAQVCRAKLQSLSTCRLGGFAAPEGVEASMQMAPDALKSALQTAGGQAQTVCSPTIQVIAVQWVTLSGRWCSCTALNGSHQPPCHPSGVRQGWGSPYQSGWQRRQ